MTQLSSPLSARGMKPIAELGARREHGDRLRYMAGCRCFQCRRANSAYEAARKVARAAGEGNGIVPAAKARAHMAHLSALGVGRRSVAAASDVADSVLTEIIAGRKQNIRAATERAILAVTVDAMGDRALVPAKATWKLLNELIKDGFTKGELALRLGYKTPALQLKKDFVTARNKHLVERLHRALQFTNAKPTMKRLKELHDEGYTVRQIGEHLVAMTGAAAPTMKPNKQGRISGKTADLIDLLHEKLTA